jgi:plasmid stability protein
MISKGSAVAQILIRDIETDVKERLQRRAARHGRSMEAEVRDILRDVVKDERVANTGLGTRIADLFDGMGLREGEEIHALRHHVIKSPFEP